MYHKIILKENSNCYYCLEDINYYIKFNCECHNYLHTECIKSNISNCLICKKNIIPENNIYSIELIFTNYLMKKINATYYLNKLTDLTIKGVFWFLLSLVSFVIFSFIILLPCLLLDLILIVFFVGYNFLNNFLYKLLI